MVDLAFDGETNKKETKLCDSCSEEAGNWRYEEKIFCSGDCLQEYLDQNKPSKSEMVLKMSKILKAKFIGGTHSSTNFNLNRWECPHCKENKKGECRFNLDYKKVNCFWRCRFCKNKLKLEYNNK